MLKNHPKSLNLIALFKTVVGKDNYNIYSPF